MTAMRLIIVNDRSFFEPTAPSGAGPAGFGTVRGSVDPGGLATALTQPDFADKLFVSSARGPEQKAMAANGAMTFDADDRHFRVRMVDQPHREYRKFYDVAANRLLWYLHHGRPPGVGPAEIDAYRAGYVPVNETIAKAVVQEVESCEDRVHVLWQDYQFYLAPAIARRMLRPSTLERTVFQHFLHVPFPDPDQWATLDRGMRSELLCGLLGNDMVGFQLPSYGLRFLRCCERFLGLRTDEADGVVFTPSGRQVRVTSHPIPATPQHVRATATTTETRDHAARLRQRAGDRQVIYRTERVDPVKAFPEAMRAYELLLRRPGMAGNVVYVAQLVPSRTTIADFVAERERDAHLAQEINGRFGTADWQPVDLVFERDFARAVAGYLEYDVLDIVPWADGMNLVALEGPAVNRRDGALVLAETAGAHHFLGRDAIGVKPGDPHRHADAMHEAIAMPRSERARRAASLRQVALAGDPSMWLSDQVHQAAELLPRGRPTAPPG